MTLVIERLSARTGSDGVVNVAIADFQPLAASAPLAVELAAVCPELALRRIDAARDLAGTYHYRGLSELADGYAALLDEQGPVDCVVGYCSATGLAELIAARLGGPPLVLVKPTRPTVEQAIADFGSFLTKLRSPVRVATLDLAHGGPDAHAVMNGALGTALADWSAADGMDEDEVALLEHELLARFDGWLGFLLATAATRDPVPVRLRTVVPGPNLDDRLVRATAAGIRQIVSASRGSR